MENIDQKTLFVAFTPGQAADLAEGRSVFPQETSERFGLRTTKEEAIERAHYFHKWHSEIECGHQSRGDSKEGIYHCHHSFECVWILVPSRKWNPH